MSPDCSPFETCASIIGGCPDEVTTVMAPLLASGLTSTAGVLSSSAGSRSAPADEALDDRREALRLNIAAARLDQACPALDEVEERLEVGRLNGLRGRYRSSQSGLIFRLGPFL